MKTLTGQVVSTGMNKTAVVQIERAVMHPLYKKSMRRSKRFKVHREGIDVAVGDMVKIASTRPISKEKHFRIVEKL